MKADKERRQPALLCLGLSNGHWMVVRLERSDSQTLPILNRGYGYGFHALALLQKGNLDYIAGRGVIARSRDLDEPWHENQPHFFRAWREVVKYARRHNIDRLLYSDALIMTLKSQPERQPKKSTGLTVWQEWRLTR